MGKSNTTDLSGGGRAFTIGPAGATLNSASAGQTWSIVPYILGAADDYPLVSNGGLLTLTGVGNGLISKAIPGSGGVTMAGAGTWTLGGSNTYSGPTTINQGKLLVDGWLTSSAVAVNSGGTLGGTGDVTLRHGQSRRAHCPRRWLRRLERDGNLTLLAGAAMDFALDSPGIGYDQLDISGLATLGGTLNIGLVSGFSPSYGENFDVLIGSTSGSFSQTNLPVLGSGLRWDAPICPRWVAACDGTRATCTRAGYSPSCPSLPVCYCWGPALSHCGLRFPDSLAIAVPVGKGNWHWPKKTDTRLRLWGRLKSPLRLPFAEVIWWVFADHDVHGARQPHPTSFRNRYYLEKPC